VWKNSCIFATDIQIIHVNFTFIEIIFSEKNGGITFVPPLALSFAAISKV
jgi:hypothetical protein